MTVTGVGSHWPGLTAKPEFFIHRKVAGLATVSEILCTVCVLRPIVSVQSLNSWRLYILYQSLRYLFWRRSYISDISSLECVDSAVSAASSSVGIDQPQKVQGFIVIDQIFWAMVPMIYLLISILNDHSS